MGRGGRVIAKQPAGAPSAWGNNIADAKQNYLAARKSWRTPEIIAIEKSTHELLVQATEEAISDILDGFQYASHSREHWLEHAPAQRGHMPSGQSVPWLEVAETVVGTAVGDRLRALQEGSTLGLPCGSDIRWASENWLLHLDVKATGPNDNPDEIVVSPNQMSGNGALSKTPSKLRVQNSLIYFYGQRDSSQRYSFQPHLPPFYPADPQHGFPDPLLCVTSFIKANYSVEDLGHQELVSLEISTTPNGLLGHRGKRDFSRFMRRGKDSASSKKQRVRIPLDSLVALDDWRSTQLLLQKNWKPEPRKP